MVNIDNKQKGAVDSALWDSSGEGTLDEALPLVKTDCFRLVRYEVNHFSVALVMLRDVSLSIIRRWSKVSKALLKSMKVARVYC